MRPFLSLRSTDAYRPTLFPQFSVLLCAHRHHLPYAASKGAMNQMLKVMAFEWANNGIYVNAVCAGYSETLPTKIFQASPVKKELSLKISLGRLTTPEEIVASVRILSSTKCDYVPRQVLFVH